MAHIPSQIGKYELVRRLGQGGMGSVYLAKDRDLDRFVAIKVLREQLFDDELLQRFFREARAAANLRHDNIITIYDVGQHDHQPYMALEYVDGQTLLEIVRNRPPLPLAEKLSYVEQICAGLHFAHGAGIVHRDIKPANVMVDARGVIRILDFGIARVEGSGMTGDGALIGTLNYMSPEQMLGRPVDFRSDIFAVGTLAYELITYNKAFPGSLDDGLLQKLPYEDPPALHTYCEGLPDGLEALVFRALSKNPADRFADLEQMRVAIRELRRDLDPELALETIVVTSRRGDRTRGSSASGRSEHPEFAERRARQIAVHLEAARAALLRQDVDGAIAACEDALTLAPDNPDALALLDQAGRAKQQRDDQSRARRERERTVRQRVADADLRLSKGDVAGAVSTLEQALSIDPANVAGLALLPRVREAAEAAGLLLPASLLRPIVAAPAGDAPAEEMAATELVHPLTGAAPTVLAPRQAAVTPESDAPPSVSRRTSLVAAAAAAIVVAAAGGTWLLLSEPSPGERTVEAPAASGQSGADTAAAVDLGVDDPAIADPLPPPAIETGAPAAGNAPAAQPPVASAVSQPAATPPPAASVPDLDAALRRRIADVTATYRGGDIAAALNGIEPLLDTSDDREVRELAGTLAQAAMRSMNAAVTSADVRRAAERAPQTYEAALRAKTRAEEALARNEYVEAGRVALAAAAGFSQAEREASLAASRQPAVLAGRGAGESSASAGTPVADAAVQQPVPNGAAAPPVRPPAAPAATTSPAAIAPPRDDAGIFALLGRYQDGYRELSIDKLLEIFPLMPRERQQQLRKDFDNYRGCDVQFLNQQVLYAGNDPNAATVTARTTYSCQPKTRQPVVAYSIDEIFQVRKFGEGWLIQSTGVMDAGKR